MKPRIKTAVLISGRGTNMESLARAAQDPDYPAEIALVISNRPSAAGLDRARAIGIPAICINHRRFKSRRNYEKKLQASLTEYDIELICCAGFMRVLTAWFTRQWERRMLNIHPSLLPKYKGLNTHQRAIEAGDTDHGCTVHYVTAKLDSGAIIDQARIKIMPSDTPETLAERLLAEELQLYPKALRPIAEALRK